MNKNLIILGKFTDWVKTFGATMEKAMQMDILKMGMKKQLSFSKKNTGAAVPVGATSAIGVTRPFPSKSLSTGSVNTGIGHKSVLKYYFIFSAVCLKYCDT